MVLEIFQVDVGDLVQVEITVDGRVLFPHSLGIFYQAFTQYLGFPNYGDEYKVMGLAPYGNPKYERQIEEVINCDENGAYKLNLKFLNIIKSLLS